MQDHLNYSSVDFRQSSHLPQKPSKTLSSKLGDCKDFSTLFKTLAEMAGVKSNLVLVMTNYNGLNTTVLPSINFNHCIVKVHPTKGAPYYLELTDKYNPFKSLPINLYQATILEIPTSNNGAKKYELERITDLQIPSQLNVVATIELLEDHQKFSITHDYSGVASGYYRSLFAGETNKELIKDNYKDGMQSFFSYNFTVEEVSAEKQQWPNFVTTSKLKCNGKISTIGSMQVYKLPKLLNIFDNVIIEKEKRNFDIEYFRYEPNSGYKVTYHLKLPEGKKFTEYPEGKLLSFKDKSYELSSELLSDRELNLIIDAKCDKDNITVEEYEEFKKFVLEVLHTEDIFIGYK